MNEALPFAYLALVTVFASTVQAALGFGAMLMCLTLGCLLLPVSEVLAVMLPVVAMMAGTVVVRHRRDVDVGLLVRRVLPLMSLGFVVSVVAFAGVEGSWMKPVLGGLVLVLALRELIGLAGLIGGPPRGEVRDEGAREPGSVLRSAALFGAGLVHGVFATGGPLLVWALAQEPLDKATLRATLPVAFLVANIVLVLALVGRGALTVETAQLSAGLFVPLLVGVKLGEWMHDRVDEQRFRIGVWGLLAVSAVSLIV